MNASIPRSLLVLLACLAGTASAANHLVTDIPGCQLWLDADDPGKIALDGSRVIEWRDKSPYGMHFSQYDTSLAPLYQPNQTNGRPRIWFDQDHLRCNEPMTPDLETGGTWFIVFYMNTWNNNQTVITKGTNGNFDLTFRPVAGSVTKNENNFGLWSNGAIAESNSWAVPLQTCTIVEYNFDSARTSGKVRFYKNGLSIGQSDAIDFVPTPDDWPMTLGANLDPSAAGYFAGGIHEVIYYADALDTVRRNNVGYYLQQKYALSGSYSYYPPPTPTNYLLPDDFEDYLDDADLNSLWSSSGVLTLSNLPVYEGDQAMKAQFTQPGFLSKTLGAFDYSQRDLKYDLAIRLQAAAANTATVPVRFELRDTADVLLATETVIADPAAPQWQTALLPVDIDPTYLAGWQQVHQIHIFVDGPGTFYFDAAQFVPSHARRITGPFPDPGEWPAHNRGAGLTARSPGSGAITSPTWRPLAFVGAHDNLLLVQSGATSDTLPVANLPAAADSLADPRFALIPDLPTGQSLLGFAPGFNNDSTYAHVLPGEPCLQFIHFESGFSLPTINGQWQPARGRCYKWTAGAWQLAWETSPFSNLFISNTIAGDFDADGSVEIAFLPMYQIVVLDGATGNVEDQLQVSNGRNYGYFGTADIDGNGKQEFIIISDFVKHIEVCGYDDSNTLQRLWQRNLEMTLVSPQRQVRVNPFCIADVNGDGNLDIVVSLHNPPASAGTASYNDNAWHVVAYDGLTGAVLADYPYEYLSGLVDVDQDGVSELLTQSAPGPEPAALGTIRVRDAFNQSVRWSLDDAAWQMYDPANNQSISHVITTQERLVAGDAQGPKSFWTRGTTDWTPWQPDQPYQEHSAAVRAHVNILHRFIDNVPAVIIRQAGTHPDDVTLRLARWNAAGFTSDYAVAGRHLVGLAISDQGEMVVRHTDGDPAATLATTTATPAKLFTSYRGVNAATAAVAWNQNATKPVIVVQGAADEEELVVLEPRLDDFATELCRISGRGQGDSWPGNYGPVIADLDADGQRELLRATADPLTGCARLIASDLTGNELWHHDFNHIPGTAPIWNMGGIVFWTAGNFTSNLHQDVLVTVRRNIMHSEETFLISGLDGSYLWHRTGEPLNGRATGGQQFALADFDHDGLLEAASLYPDILYVLDGQTGDDLIIRTVSSLPGHPSNSSGYWGIPIAADFRNDGLPAIFHATTRSSLTGLIVPDAPSASAAFAWADAVDTSPQILPAFGDFDGDGQWQVMSPGFADGMRCYDAATGAVEWTIPGPGWHNGLASGDIDNDGRDEALFSVGSQLQCYGDGLLQWQLDLPTSIGPPSLADLDGSGNLSILLVGYDGWVYAIESPPGNQVTLPKVALTATQSLVREDSGDPLVFTVTRTNVNTHEPLEIALELDGAAVPGASYTPPLLPVTIDAHQLTADILIPPLDNQVFEGSRSLIVRLLDGPYDIYEPRRSVTGTILDDDQLPLAWRAWNTVTPIHISGFEDSWNPLADFPLAVVLPDSFDYTSVADPVAAGDLRFIDKDGQELAYEIEQWNPAGTSACWVKMPLLTNADECIYLLSDNPAQTTPPPYRTDGSVWSNGFDAVYHFHQNVNDSGPLALHAQDINTTDSALITRIGHARAFNGSTSCLSLPPAATANLQHALAISFWFKQDAYIDHNYMGLITQAQAWGDNFSFMLDLTNDGGGNDLRFALSNNGLNMAMVRHADTSFAQWHHVTATWDGAEMKLYLDGQLAQAAPFTGQLFQSPATPVVGSIYYTSSSWNKFRGAMDELRISHTPRDQSWIQASYRNGNGQLTRTGQPVHLDPADLDASGFVDTADLALLAANWLESAIDGALVGDLDYSGAINLHDFSILTRDWLNVSSWQQ